MNPAADWAARRFFTTRPPTTTKQNLVLFCHNYTGSGREDTSGQSHRHLQWARTTRRAICSYFLEDATSIQGEGKGQTDQASKARPPDQFPISPKCNPLPWHPGPAAGRRLLTVMQSDRQDPLRSQSITPPEEKFILSRSPGRTTYTRRQPLYGTE